MTEFFTLVSLAALSGVLTIIAPCILSLLPIMLGSSLGGGSKFRPLFVVLGMVASFTAFGFIFAASTNFLGLTREAVRTLATILIFLFGLALVFSQTYDRLVAQVRAGWHKLAGRPTASLPIRREGLRGAFTLGASMGVTWVPCAGPVLGIILTIATIQGNLIGGTILFFAYALGAAVPMLLIGYGGAWVVRKVRWLTAKVETIRKIAGAILIVMAIAIFFGLDRRIETAAFSFFANTTAIEEDILDRTFSEDTDMGQLKNAPLPPTDMPLLLPARRQ